MIANHQAINQVDCMIVNMLSRVKKILIEGKMEDKPYNIWASDNEGVGAWIEIHFKKQYMITRIVYRDRDNSAMRNRLITVMF